VLRFHFNWKTLSVMAGITWWNFYFKLFPGAIKAPQIIEFLEHLLRHLRRPLLVIWDGLPGHRSGAVRDFVAAQGRRLTLEWLPGYAPETQSRRTYLELPQGTRTAQSVPARTLAAQRRGTRCLAADATPAHTGHGILETGRTILSVTCLCNAL
jgi:hypothetical protein